MQDPENFQLVGIPPEDLLEEVARAWQTAGLNVDTCFTAAAEVTKEWEYKPASSQERVCVNVRSRFAPKQEVERRVPLQLKSLADILNPQPAAAEVLHAVLQWIDDCDQASQRGTAAPPPERRDGTPPFPETMWWLTELERRKPAEVEGECNDEVAYDDNDLTGKPEDAWWPSGSSEESGSDEQESDGSLPAGPARKVYRRSAEARAAKQESASASARGGLNVGAAAKRQMATAPEPQNAPRRRLRGKQPETRDAPADRHTIGEGVTRLSGTMPSEAPPAAQDRGQQGPATALLRAATAAGEFAERCAETPRSDAARGHDRALTPGLWASMDESTRRRHLLSRAGLTMRGLGEEKDK